MCYHGDLSPVEKMNNMKKWQNDETHVIVATKSLGMGIDKPNVRCIFHSSFPSSVSEYYQQVGRAGRDGERADCILFYRFPDRALHLAHISKCETETGKQNGIRELRAMIKLCTSVSCLKQFYDIL